jgi:hypothetical protein
VYDTLISLTRYPGSSNKRETAQKSKDPTAKTGISTIQYFVGQVSNASFA